MPPIYINGRFTTQRLTGVQRVAQELVAALDRRLLRGTSMPGCTLLLPPTGVPPTLARLPVRVVPGPRRPHLWEQGALPRAARGALLLNLCGAAPAWFAGHQACVLHDAAVFDHPEAYSAAFVRWYRWLFRRHARRGTRLITVSAFSRGRLAAALGVPLERFAVIPLAADHMARASADSALLQAHGLDRMPFLLAVGSGNPTKRLDRLVRAWSGLGRDNARLVIAGGLNPRVFAGAGLPAAAGVVVLGPVDDAALKALYRAAAGLVFPSVYEGFGLPPLEAMACGCPVAAARTASLPEVCGDAALMFDPDDEAALAAAMRALLDDADLRRRLRASGLARAAGFRWDDSAAALLAALGAPGEPVARGVPDAAGGSA
jgi:glycosyltransferase involved in cell wall biosynthesis